MRELGLEAPPQEILPVFNSIDRDGSGTLCSSRLLHTLYVGRGPYALLCRRVAVARAQLRGTLLWRSCAHACYARAHVCREHR